MKKVMGYLFFNIRKPPEKSHQLGFVLVTVLLLLSILSVSALVAVEQSQLNYKVNHARIAQMKARQASEFGRLQAIQTLQTMLRDTSQNTHQYYSGPVSNRHRSDSFKHFITVNNANGKANVFLRTLSTEALKNGVSLSQHTAYSGMGSGLGLSGSFSTHYEIRAQGSALDQGHSVDVWTASDFLFVH